MNENREPKIVVIGGGTGSFVTLRGLKKYVSNITSLVSMADDGGSTVVARRAYCATSWAHCRQAMCASA